MSAKCEICKGSGFVSKGQALVECECKLRERLLAYLTPFYASSTLIEGMDASKMQGKNLVASDMELSNFKSIVKSFLLLSLKKPPHHTVTAHDIIQSYVQAEGATQYSELTEFPLLFIYLNNDPPNRQYSEIIGTLITKRQMKSNVTWVYSRTKVPSQDFSFRYGEGLQEQLSKRGGFTSIAK